MTYGFPIHFPRKTHECVNMNSLKKNKETRREGKEKEGRGERGERRERGTDSGL